MLPPAGFRDVTLCGTGATSRVYRAVQTGTERTVALKRLHRQLARTPEALSRLRRELEALGRLRHHGIAAVIDVIRWQGDPTVVMEYVPGRDLKEQIAETGPLSFSEVERIARALLDILQAAHAAGIVHRDVKPQNVRLAADGTVYLLDFGSARFDAASHLTTTGTAVGTPDYMAPELFAGSVYDPRADVYGLGATLFEALAGVVPQTAESLTELAYRRIHEDPPPVSTLREATPPHLAQVVDRCLSRAPEKRYASAVQAVWALDHPEAERRFITRRSDNPPCLHCGTSIAPESNLCPACGSDHPFSFGAGSSHVNIVGVDDPAELTTELLSLFPEHGSPSGIQAISERWAALADAKQRLVSFIDREEARALADRLERSGARCELEEDPGLTRWKRHGPLLYGVLAGLAITVILSGAAAFDIALPFLLFLPVLGALLAERWIVLDRAAQGILTSSRARASIAPAVRRALLAAVPGLGLLAWTLPSIAQFYAAHGGAPWISDLLPRLSAPLLFGAVSSAGAVWLAGRIGRFTSPRGPGPRALASPEPSFVEKAYRTLSVPARRGGGLDRSVAAGLTAVVLLLVPAELAGITVAKRMVPTFWSLWSEASVTFEAPKSAMNRLVSEPVPSPAEPAWAPPPSAGAPVEAPSPIIPTGHTVSLPPAPVHPPIWADVDPIAAGSATGILFADAFLLLLLAFRRRRVLREAERVGVELLLPVRFKTPPRSRRASALAPADRFAERAMEDRFLQDAKLRAADLVHDLSSDELARFERALDAVRERRDRSFLARCILETDDDLHLRFEILRLTGRMETAAAERWAAGLEET